jgi:hypothetical protein
MTGGGTFQAFFLLPELAIGAPSYCFIYGNERSLSRLMIATHQVGGKDDMGALDKERLMVV